MVDRGAKTKIRVFSFIFIMLAIVIIAVAASSTLNAATRDSQQESGQQQRTSSGINSDSAMNISDGSADSSLPSVSGDDEELPGGRGSEGTRLPSFPSLNSPSPGEVKPANSTISEEDARRIAMPDIEKYASEHNRTIRNVSAKFYPIDSRVPRPCWEIVANYVRGQDRNDPEYYIIGYFVSVWADTGEIRASEPSGVY